jgi:hypothetical protein
MVKADSTVTLSVAFPALVQELKSDERRYIDNSISDCWLSLEYFQWLEFRMVWKPGVVLVGTLKLPPQANGP